MDYIKKCEEAKKPLLELLEDRGKEPRKNGNLAYAIQFAIRRIDDIEKFIARFGTD